MKLKEKLARFLSGRYGSDQLNTALCILALVFFIIAAILGHIDNTACFVISVITYVLAIAALGYSFFRTFSRNLSARHAENEWFRKKFIIPFKRKSNELSTRRRQKETHKFFKCPKCRQTVRVPKGKGKVRITCPKCGEVFIKET